MALLPDIPHVGGMRTVTAAFTNAQGAATDPTTTKLYVKKPNQTFITYVYPTDTIIVKDSIGNYHADLSLDVPGIWRYEWEGDGAVQADGEGSFGVSPSIVRA